MAPKMLVWQCFGAMRRGGVNCRLAGLLTFPDTSSTVQWKWSPPFPGRQRRPSVSTAKHQKQGMQGAGAAKLPPFMSIVRHACCPVIRVHAKGVVLCENPCFCLLSAFYDTPPLLRTLLRTPVSAETLTRRLLRTLLRSTAFKWPPWCAPMSYCQKGRKGAGVKGAGVANCRIFSFCCAFRCRVVYSPCFPVWGEELWQFMTRAPLPPAPFADGWYWAWIRGHCEGLSEGYARLCGLLRGSTGFSELVLDSDLMLVTLRDCWNHCSRSHYILNSKRITSGTIIAWNCWKSAGEILPCKCVAVQTTRNM